MNLQCHDRQGLAPSLGLEHSTVISAHCSLNLQVQRWVFATLARLVLNFWAQAVFLPWPPKVLGLQACTTVPSPILHRKKQKQHRTAEKLEKSSGQVLKQCKKGKDKLPHEQWSRSPGSHCFQDPEQGKTIKSSHIKSNQREESNTPDHVTLNLVPITSSPICFPEGAHYLISHGQGHKYVHNTLGTEV
ncbi:hypothetical protein AAY473_027743 [Plecturocebus cupreus]